MKSNASDYLELAERVYRDAAAKCSADVSDLRDLKTIRSRIKDEGFSFLTITLPNFARDLERALANGYIGPTLFRGFKRVRCGSIPEFLQGMIAQVFDRETGEMITNENPKFIGADVSDFPTVIESVRQICCTFKKVEMACTPERVQAALDNFIAIEQSFESFTVPTQQLSKFLDVSDVLWHNLVANFSAAGCTPRHGPGATAERISGNQKYRWQRWHDRLEPYFPLVDNGYPLGIPDHEEELEIVTIIPPEEEQPVRVVPVPKTLKSPRIIAIEPCCMQYVQQGIRDFLYEGLESYWLTRGHINFRDQGINQRLAMESSVDGRLATIDLSDASDRVPWSLAQLMFRSSPELLESIDACRSTSAHLPDGRIVAPLKKFASMGSALCFPVEAMYFYTVCVVALLDSMSLSCSPSNVLLVTRDLYVYGDDIVVPVANADVVLDYLQKYNCKVNTNKTFVSGNFRESCGVDAFRGYEVTPIYLRKEHPENKQQSDRLISWVQTANQFYRKGYWQTADFIFRKVESIIGSLPYVSQVSSGLGRQSFLGYESVGRWNRTLHRFEVKAMVPEPVYRTDELGGFGALMKCFINMYRRTPEVAKPLSFDDAVDNRAFRDEITVDTDLCRSALHGAVTLKRRWIPSQTRV